MWQIIDVFSSFGNTVLTVWDGQMRRRKTLKLNGSYDFRVGQMLAWEKLANNHVSLHLVVDDIPNIGGAAIIPINHEMTVLERIAI